MNSFPFLSLSNPFVYFPILSFKLMLFYFILFFILTTLITQTVAVHNSLIQKLALWEPEGLRIPQEQPTQSTNQRS